MSSSYSPNKYGARDEGIVQEMLRHFGRRLPKNRSYVTLLGDSQIDEQGYPMADSEYNQLVGKQIIPSQFYAFDDKLAHIEIAAKYINPKNLFNLKLLDGLARHGKRINPAVVFGDFMCQSKEAAKQTADVLAELVHLGIHRVQFHATIILHQQFMSHTQYLQALRKFYGHLNTNDSYKWAIDNGWQKCEKLPVKYYGNKAWMAIVSWYRP